MATIPYLKKYDAAKYLMTLAAHQGDALQAKAVSDALFGEKSQPSQVLNIKVLGTDALNDAIALRGLSNGLLQSIRDQSLLGKIAATIPLRQLPINTPVLQEDDPISAEWVGEGLRKPVKDISLALAPKLQPRKLSIITPFTQALLKAVDDDNAQDEFIAILTAAIADAESQSLLATTAATANAPAGLLYGIDPIASTGTPSENLETLLDAFLGDINKSVLIMDAGTALALNRAGTDTLSIKGGNFAGIPVIVSKSAGERIVALDVNQLFVNDSGVLVDVSDNAILETESGEWLNLYQQNFSAIRADRFVTWAIARNDAVAYISKES